MHANCLTHPSCSTTFLDNLLFNLLNSDNDHAFAIGKKEFILYVANRIFVEEQLNIHVWSRDKLSSMVYMHSQYTKSHSHVLTFLGRYPLDSH